jgi:hypothetical protein
VIQAQVPLSTRKDGVTDIDAFRRTLLELRRAFIDWRYLHEKESAGEVHIQAMISVMEILHEVCRAAPAIRQPEAAVLDAIQALHARSGVKGGRPAASLYQSDSRDREYV